MDIPIREFLMPSSAYAAMYLFFLASSVILLYGLYSHIRSYGIGLVDFLGLLGKDFWKKAARFLKFGVARGKY